MTVLQDKKGATSEPQLYGDRVESESGQLSQLLGRDPEDTDVDGRVVADPGPAALGNQSPVPAHRQAPQHWRYWQPLARTRSCPPAVVGQC